MIPKRLFWFGVGAASGFAGAAYAYARVREVQGRFAADRVAGTVSDVVVGSVRTVRTTIAEAIYEGRQAARLADERIRADLDAIGGRRAI